MNKKQFLKAISFILIALFLLIHLTYCVRTNGDVKDRFVGFYAEKKNTVDAVVIGSSPVYPVFATPKIYGDMGITMYPLSSNMQRPVATKYLVEEALKTQSPELFIFEMRMWTAEDENLLGNMAHTREVTDNMKYSVNRIKTINAMVEDPSERLTYYFDIFKYHSNWKTLALWSQLRTFFYSYPDDLKGYVAETDVGPCTVSEFASLTDKEPMPAEQEEYLRDLLKYLKEKNLNALFVITPYTVKEDEQKKINYMSDIVESYGYNFLDMNQHIDEIGLVFEEDFRDFGTHTNVVGAEKVTDYFEQYLKDNYVDKLGILTRDHRNDHYKSWDEAYKLYCDNIDNWKSTVQYNLDNEIYYDLEGED
ncbi:SGNH/GDSL hydrolase family protein [Butyrivibrio proteoclasticus]|uniref:SGNH/GDSL hydrolase family protein n=1 Tax=Butyrivibrio proteoclasticus TaxID=43305 RepID=UPI00047935C6|nr:SGNH/GDSL hydrolase family protein [Butyrivibrio proteoclasticus]